MKPGPDPKILNMELTVLRRSLTENENSWQASGFGAIKNPVADSIRRSIVEKEALLATMQ
jgi:hypothetical protein